MFRCLCTHIDLLFLHVLGDDYMFLVDLVWSYELQVEINYTYIVEKKKALLLNGLIFCLSI